MEELQIHKARIGNIDALYISKISKLKETFQADVDASKLDLAQVKKDLEEAQNVSGSVWNNV